MLIASILCHIAFGALLSVIFILYYINGDGKWKIYLEILIGISGNYGSIFILDKLFKVNNDTIRMYSISACIFSFLIITFLSLMLMSFIIKDRFNKDIFRLRDILLGQTSWVKKYYEIREKEINEKLNIPMLEKREKDIIQKENLLFDKEQYINQELEKINNIGNKKLRLFLPENKSIIITKNFIEILPSYIGGFAKCINDIKTQTDLFLSKKDNNDGCGSDIEKLKTYLLLVSTFISQHIFGSSSDIRIHFRYYNKNTKKYEKLVSIIGLSPTTKNMTPIPYKNSMIERSFICKRALIKSINTDFDYKSSNNMKWKDYMTFTFYNLKKDEIPYLTFGISVKNAVRYKDIFYFLNFVELETYLNDYIEIIDQEICLEKILYNGGDL